MADFQFNLVLGVLTVFVIVKVIGIKTWIEINRLTATIEKAAKKLTHKTGYVLLPDGIEMVSLQRARPGEPPRWCALAIGAKRAAYGATEAEAREAAKQEKV